MTAKGLGKNALARIGTVWTGPGRGIKLEGTASARLYLGLYEIEVNRWIRRLAEPGVAAFDIGAGYGFEAMMFARLTHAPVLTIDSDAGLEALICRNVGRNDLTGTVEPLFGWVGDGTDGTVTIDHLAADHFAPGFVKMDIEGAEAAALRGATDTLERCDRWLIETHGLDVENECLSTLAAHGFQLEIQNQRRWVKDRRPIPHNRWVIATRSRAH